MKIIIDTHTFLWFINEQPELSATIKTLIESDTDVLLSVVSLWEIAVKVSIGKMTLPDAFERFIPEQLMINDIEILPIALPHLTLISALPFHHRDPFDRLLIAQSIVEDLPITSIDKAFDAYGVNRIW
jgi:PIN domain nuclease of toxin-antitoxin system